MQELCCPSIAPDRVKSSGLASTSDGLLAIAEMDYPDQKTFEAAMQSSENRAVADDLTSFAKGKVKLLVAESEDK
jgi:uncharacterized protein (TIGR02118 family)